jgi:hypothetical protein
VFPGSWFLVPGSWFLVPGSWFLVAVALAEAGADIAVGGPKGDLAAEAALHSIANEIWALSRRSTVVMIEDASPTAFAAAMNQVATELGHADLVVRCDIVASG